MALAADPAVKPDVIAVLRNAGFSQKDSLDPAMCVVALLNERERNRHSLKCLEETLQELVFAASPIALSYTGNGGKIPGCKVETFQDALAKARALLPG